MKYKTSDVFVAGGMPQFTYINRVEKRLEEQLRATKDNLCKLVTVTGDTKSGKTVLVSKIFPKDVSVWVDGGTIDNEDDFWSFILDQLSGYTEISEDNSRSSKSEVGIEIDAKGKIPLLAELSGGLNKKSEETEGETHSRRLTLSNRAAALSQLQKLKKPLIVDDFHYIDRSFQGKIVRALKPMVFAGIPVVLIAIPHRRYDAIKVEREMTGRLEQIRVPTWEHNELIQIPQIGFPLLNVSLSREIQDLFASEAYGSPHLMQDFCRAIAEEYNTKSTLSAKLVISTKSDKVFSLIADQTGKTIFDKLARGPRQRSDRIQRELRVGGTADIYRVTLMALSELKPGLITITYETIRTSLKRVLKGRIPQPHEVSRVFEQMSHIASIEGSSTPVLDWEKEERKLHITDPFFAFYLKWGMAEGKK